MGLTIDLYAIRHKPTGYWIPARKNRRGGSHDEPEQTVTPRMFFSKRSAGAFMSQWLRGIHIPFNHQSSWDGDWDNGVDIKRVESRRKEEMEIVAFVAIEQHRDPAAIQEPLEKGWLQKVMKDVRTEVDAWPPGLQK